jgi:hypothetical protein
MKFNEILTAYPYVSSCCRFSFVKEVCGNCNAYSFQTVDKSIVKKQTKSNQFKTAGWMMETLK